MSFPYAEDAGTWLARHPLEHLATLSIDGHTIPITSGTLAWHGNAIPSYTADLTIPLTDETAALLDFLDPRLSNDVNIYAGYRYPTGITDVQLIGKLYTQDVDQSDEDSAIYLTMASAESLLFGTRALWGSEIAAIPRTGVPEAVRHIITTVVSGAYVHSDLPDGSYADVMTDLEVNQEDPWLDVIEEITQAADLRLSVNRNGNFILGTRRLRAYDTGVATLATGESGTVTSLSRRRSLEEWANSVRIRAPRPDDPTRTHTGTATATQGPFGTWAVPRRVHSVTLDRPISRPTLDRRARAMLPHLFTLGAGYNIRAVSAYWLRPDSTVAIAPGGETIAHQLVRNVTYDFANGTMSLSTREDTAPLDLTTD